MASTDSAPVSLADAYTLFTSFETFLNVAIHSITYYRHIYPPRTFLSTRAYNAPVHQNRHPRVVAWIRDTVSAVLTQIAAGSVSRVAVVIHAPIHKLATTPDVVDGPRDGKGKAPSGARPQDSSTTKSSITTPSPGAVLERWLFDVSYFPAWPGGIEAMRAYRPDGKRGSGTARVARDPTDAGVLGEAPSDDDDNSEDDVYDGDSDSDDEGVEAVTSLGNIEEDESGGEAAPDDKSSVNWVDFEEQLRGTIIRLAHSGEKMGPLPQGCTFTVAVELRDEAEAPIGHPQPWIPADPSRRTTGLQVDRIADGARLTPIRSVAAGPLWFECWVEEGKAKEVVIADMSAVSSDNTGNKDLSKPQAPVVVKKTPRSILKTTSHRPGQ